jgi:hypothetical protein
MIMEEWRVIPEFSDYEVSNLGRVRRKTKPLTRSRIGHILKQTILPNGYHLVSLWVNNANFNMLTHQLVYMAFNGPIPIGHDIHHKDTIKAHNYPENLGTVCHYLHTAKFDAIKMKDIKSKLFNGYSIVALSKENNISQRTLRRVLNGERWKHI